MKVEIMTSGEFHDMVKNVGIDARRMYKCPQDIYNDHPYYEIWSVEKHDLRKLEEARYEEYGTWFRHSNGANRGTAYDLVTINGVPTIAWLEGSTKDTFYCLTDYYKECLGVTDNDMICGYSVYLAKTNGWSLADLWKKLEG